MGENLYEDAIDQLDEAGPAPTQAPNPYLETMDSLAGEKQRGMRTAAVAAADANPDQAAKVRKLSELTGLAPEVVERNYDRLSKRATVEGVPYEQILAETPAVAEWSTESNNAAVAKDDLEQLGFLEWVVTAPQRAFAQAIHHERVAKIRTQQLFRDLTQEERDQLATEKLYADMGGKQGAGDSWFRNTITGGASLLENVLGGIASAGPKMLAFGTGGAVLGAAGGFMTAGPPGAVVGAIETAKAGAAIGGAIGAAQYGFELEAGLALDEFLEVKDEQGNPLDPAVARGAALAAGAINAGLEVVGLNVLAKSIPGLEKLKGIASRNAIKQALRNPTIRSAIGQAVKSYAGTLTSETAVEVAQRAVTILSGELGKAASGQNVRMLTKEEIAADLAREAVGALQGFTLLAGAGPTMSLARDVSRVQRADQAQAFYQVLGEGAAQSKTIERLPKAAQQLLEKATADGPIPNVYAPADTFREYFQSQGLDPAKVAAELTGKPDALEEAEARGGDLEIPTAVYATRLAGTEHHAALSQEIRLGPDEMNAREAQAFREQLLASLEQRKAEAEIAAEGPAAAVRQDLTAKLEAVGVPRGTAEQYAGLYEATFGALAERAGVDPAELYQQYGLAVLGPGTAPERGRGPAPAGGVGTSASPAPAREAGLQETIPGLSGVPVGSEQERLLRAAMGSGGGAAVATDPREQPVLQEGQTAEAGQPALDRDAAIPAMTDITGAAARMMAENPNIMREAEELRARSQASRKAAPKRDGSPAEVTVESPGSGEASTAGGDTRETAPEAPRGVQLPGDASQPRAAADERVQPKRGAADRPGARERRSVPASQRSRLDALIADARARGFTGSDRALESSFLDRLETATAIAADLEAEANLGGWRQLLTAISQKGGISIDRDPESRGELESFMDYLAKGSGLILKSGRNRVKRQGQRMPLNSVGIKGAPGIIKQTGGTSLDDMRDLIATDPDFPGNLRERWQDLTAFMEDLEDALIKGRAENQGEAIPGRSTPDVESVLVDFLEVREGADWWILPANLLQEQDILEGDADLPAIATDTSFNVEEFGQSLFDDLEAPIPGADRFTASPAEQTRTDGASAGSDVDKLDTGELQPRLPGAGNVRETEIATPEFEAPFALTSEVAKPRKGKQTTLFQGDVFEQSKARVAARKRAAAQLSARGEPVALVQAASGRTALAGPDMSKPGSFRLTRFEDGAPIGHTEHQSLEAAILAGLEERYLPDGPQGTYLAPAVPGAAALEQLPAATVPGVANARALPFPFITEEQSLELLNARERTVVERRSVPIASIVATQATFDVDTARDYLEAPSEEVPEALEHNGQIYLLGGTHRTLAEWAKGAESVVVDVSPVDAKRLEQRTLYQSTPALTEEAVLAFLQATREKFGADLVALDVYISTASGDLHLDTLAIAKGANRQGMGSEVMRELTRFADQYQARITLNRAEKGWQIKPPASSGPSAVTTSEDRLIRFYQRFGFVRNMGRHKDFSINAEMYREPTARVTDLGQPSRDVTQSQAFLQWFGESQVVDEDGRPLVVYHGTTADFETFDRERANPESDFGAGIYFSNDPSDVEENYAGFGPDLTQKIELRMEQLFDNLEDDERRQIVEQATGKKWEELDYQEKRGPLRDLAKQDLGVEHGGATMPVYLKFENPAIVGGPEGTQLTYEMVFEIDRDAVDEDELQRTIEDYGYETEQEALEHLAREQGDVTDERGTLVDFIVALRDVAEGYHDGSVDRAITSIMERAADGDVSLDDVIATLKEDEQFGYYTDNNGTLVSSEIIRQALERAGYDGIIDHTVDRKFGSGRAVGKQMKGMSEETVHYIAFRPEQIKSAVGNAGTFDPDNPSILHAPSRRGAIRFGANRQFSIELLEKFDLSTFLHESGHFFLEVLNDLVAKIEAIPEAERSAKQRQLLADRAALNTWLGSTGRTLTEAQHEQFARGFEAYLMEGRAPSAELRSMFARFRAWLVGIYRNLSALNVKLTDEVRGVLDRMVATDQAIAEASAEGKVLPMFLTPEAAGMSPEEFQAYERTISIASQRTREQLEARVLGELQREREAEWQARRAEILAEVTAGVHAQPVYRALAAMRKGTTPAGESLIPGEEPEPLKLSKAILVERYGADRLKRLPRPYVYSSAGGLDPDAMAEIYDYDSGDAFLTALEQAEPMRTVIERETDRRMLEEHGSILLDGTILEEAQAALSNDAREEVVRAELRALSRQRRAVAPFVQAERRRGADALAEERRERAYERRWLEAEAQLRIKIAEGAKQVEIDALRDEIRALRMKSRGAAAVIAAAIPPAAELRQHARQTIATMRIRDIRPAPFWSASRRAAQKAVALAARQDIDGAIVAKQQELINLALYREAMQVLEDVDKRVRKAKSYGTPSMRSKFGKAGEAYLDQIDGILERYEFATVSQKVLARRASLRKFIAAIEGEGLPVDLPEELLEEQRRINYREIPYEELVGVTDGIEQLAHLVRLKNRLLKQKEQRELDALAGDLAESIRGNTTRRVNTALAGDRRASEERRRTIADFFAGHRKLASLLREMDGFQDGGQAWAAIMRPLNEAGSREAEMQADATRRFAAIVEKAFPTGSDKRSLYTKLEIPEIGRSLSRMQRIMVALNCGNEGNRDRLERAYGWTSDQRQAVLETLTAKELTFVQDVLDFINSYWSEIEAKQQRVYGIAPEKVEASPITTKQGTIAGGYFPLRYDDRTNAKAINALDLEAANLAKQAAYANATTRRGHTQARAERVKMPVRLDFGVMFEHVQQVIHDLTHHETLIDIGRILGHAEVQKAILETHGDLVYKQIRNTVKDVAFGDVPATSGIERAINHVRMGATVAGLGWNLGVSILQLVGITNSMVRVGPVWVARGVGRWVRNPTTMVETVKWIEEVSPFMRARARTMQREISEIRSKVGVETGTFKGWIDTGLEWATLDTVTRQGIADSYFWLIQQMQRAVDVPTWLGAYEKAMNAGESEDRAIAIADQAVLDSQGGGQTKDLAQAQRGGPMWKLWTNFYSFFNVLYNQAAESRRRASRKDPVTIGRMASDYFMLFILPATLAFAIRELLRPRADSDDDDLLWRLAMENVSYVMGTMLGVREVAGLAAGAFGYQGPAGARAFASVGRLGTQTAQILKAETDEEREEAFDEAFWKSLNEVAGVLFHYPASQVGKTVSGAAALAEGETSNPGALIAGASPTRK